MSRIKKNNNNYSSYQESGKQFKWEETIKRHKHWGDGIMCKGLHSNCMQRIIVIMKIIQIAKILIKQIFKNRKLWQIIRS